MASPQQISYIQQRAAALGLDPNAVLAIAGHEGLSGRIGDGGHAFGPFQENNAGGVLTGRFQGMTPQQLNQWAWSQAGINDALGRIQKVAGGLKGRAAITAIASRFERPANVNAEISDALAHYGHGMPGMGQTAMSGGGSAALPMMTSAGGQSRAQLVQQLFGGIDFNSNQVHTPDISALAQLRQLNASGEGKVTGVSAPLAAAAVSGKPGIGQSIAKTALSQLNQPYQYGGQATLGHPTDCSGLLQESAAAHGIQIPRTTYDQWKVGKAVSTNQLQPGDAVFFKGSDARGNLPGHVGIYIGGGKFVEDPHTGGTVSISTLAGRSDYVGARRFY